MQSSLMPIARGLGWIYRYFFATKGIREVFFFQKYAKLLDCFIPTVRIRLRAWRALTSYNQNGRYCTLPAVPTFDAYGLWRYQDIFFSRYGNLQQTVLQLVRLSPRGLEASQIGRLLGLDQRSFLSHFRGIPGLYRERRQKQFICFCDEPSVLVEQKQRRERGTEKALSEIPSDTEAVLVLADLIKHPDSTLQDCSLRLGRKGLDVEPQASGKLLDYHG